MGVKREMQQAWIAAVRCPVCRAEVKDRVCVRVRGLAVGVGGC